MYSGTIRTALNNGLPSNSIPVSRANVSADARPQEWAVNSEEYFVRIQAAIANDSSGCRTRSDDRRSFR
jgi:hypothetical protein